MISNFTSELVDQRDLDQTVGSERHRELLFNVAALFSMTSSTCTDEQLGIYDSVLFRLAGLVEVEFRRQVAEMLARLERAPGNTLVRLARDEIAVAEPILSTSPALSDDDLVWIVETRGEEHLAAIARRRSLSIPVTDAMVPRSGEAVRRLLAANKGAAFSENGFAELIQMADNDDELRRHLGARTDVPERFIEVLVDKAAANVRTRLVEQDRRDDLKRLDEAADLARDRVVRDYWRAQYDFDDAWRRVSALAVERGLNLDVVARLVEADRFAEVVCALGMLTGVPFEDALHWMTASDPRAFIIAARAHGLSRDLVAALLEIGPWKRRLSREMRTQALARFDALSKKSASVIFVGWRNERQVS
ncbi:MAG TPA: DUF2336 domain-containing protein [Kaistiaceae bacterium]|nr:DUF2336 domain-containing protein [Kaistiaceae bacterium]